MTVTILNVLLVVIMVIIGCSEISNGHNSGPYGAAILVLITLILLLNFWPLLFALFLLFLGIFSLLIYCRIIVMPPEYEEKDGVLVAAFFLIAALGLFYDF